MRTGGYQLPFAAPLTLNLTGTPIPLGATFADPTGDVTVYFDRMLRPDASLDSTNWAAFVSVPFPTFRRWDATAVAALGTKVTFPSSNAAAAAGIPRVRYSPPPSDLLGFDGSPVGVLTDIPVTVI